MTVYPFSFHIGPLAITGFGLMVMAGFMMAGWTMARDLRGRGLGDQYAWDIVVAAVIGGILGAKLYYWALYPSWHSLFSRSGLVWYGGLIGGAAAVIFNGWRLKVPLRITLNIATPGLAVGYALGRVGCFLVQDDYGVPTSLPWGMKFPEGLPPSTAGNLARWGIEVPPDASPFEVLAVHPTQLYETAAMLIVFAVLWRLRHSPHALGWLFGVYLVLYGAERFLVEFIRAKDDRFFGGFTLAQLVSFAAVALGVYLAMKWWKRDDFSVEGVKALAPLPAEPRARRKS
ncbi:MAG: prolipoprotein diacylglyceryl transferase [Gemmatimonadota bacterium]|nr:MAG: prolipoprotein diacylglyceryl transferase [Gemmatimonadota bacterium]